MDRIRRVLVPGSDDCRAWPTSLWFAALLLAVSACSTGLWTKESGRLLPPLDPGKGRVFVYRTGTMGSTNVPEVMLNGEKLGTFARPRLVFRDVPPGSYAAATTKSATVVNFAVRAGEKTYVKLTGGFFDANMHPELVDPAQGEADVSGLGATASMKK
jgi:hypothetical protein